MSKLNYDLFLKSILLRSNLQIGQEVVIPFKGIDTDFVIINKNDNYIDIMSIDALLKNISWNENVKCYNIANNTIGGKDYKPLNYKYNSTIYNIIQNQFQYFPLEIKNLCINKEISFLNSVDFITGEITYKSCDIGKIWILSISEVFGGYNEIKYGNDNRQITQYDFFKSYSESGFKFNQGKNNKLLLNGCWLLNSAISDSINSYFVDYEGKPRLTQANTKHSSTICLRLKINA